MLDVHAPVLLSMVRSDPNLTVYDGGVPDLTEPPYVVPWISVDTEFTDRLTGETTGGIIRVTTHSVGHNASAARKVAAHVRTAYLDRAPVVAGWVSWPIRHETGLPPTRDESTGRLVIDVIDSWTYRVTRAGG